MPSLLTYLCLFRRLFLRLTNLSPSSLSLSLLCLYLFVSLIYLYLLCFTGTLPSHLLSISPNSLSSSLSLCHHLLSPLQPPPLSLLVPSRYYLPEPYSTGEHSVEAQLPEGLECERCLFQWKWNVGRLSAPASSVSWWLGAS